ncbi:glycosyltransferase family 4 protein [Patulibacter defluvii]|uniref:glycosyltransferase family 4 protein n=1 Tax=Patulibacter defluvii TaxID=3095358 RepID=UPI002A753093|nr:glycosyltransferase family 1 protein [Patulibacter sp. DM4]
MRILVDTSYALRGASGTAVYVEQLLAALAEQDVDVVALGDEHRPPPAGGGLGSVRNLAHDQRWLHLRLPALAARHRVDVVHHPLPAFSPRIAGRGPGAPAGIAQVTTVHDLAFELLPECFDPRFARWASVTHRRAALRADAVIAVSQTTALDVRERWQVPADRVVVAPHGPGQWHAREIRSGATERGPSVPLTRPYLLYVGDDEPRKDLPTLRAAHRTLTARLGDAAPDLVLAGRIAGAPAGGERIAVAPERDQLLALMDGALALVHPALHEGVGLTPLEAMARGVPVVAARAPGVTETCEDAAAYFPPRDPDGLADAVERIVAEPRLRERLAQAGRRVAGARSWSAAARAHVEAYRLAVRRRAGR